MIERSPQEAWIVGPAARVRYVNAAGAASLGYPTDALIGRPATEIDTAGVEGVEAAFDTALTAFPRGEPAAELEVEHLALDGRRIRKEIRAILIEIDGYRLLEARRLADVDAPIVAVSANAMPEDIARGATAGFAAYLTKPLDVRRVLEVVGAQLDA
jgi:CheY-like chemotaxis protein